METLTSRESANISVMSDDMSDECFRVAHESLAVAVDIETTGLAWDRDSIASVQIAVSNGPIEVVRIHPDGGQPQRIIDLLESRSILKVFHHAMFDLRFMRAAWGVRPERIACTKIASKIADPAGEVGHSLVDLVGYHLGLEIDKAQRTSDWQAAELSVEQVTYAANDVRHLLPLLYSILGDLRSRALEPLTLKCFDHIPVRVELETSGLGDVYTY